MKTQQLNAEYLDISPEVAQALAEKKPVVALESTIISHGMPYPDNVKMALEVEQRIRDNGAIPATIAVINGRMKAGLSHDEIEMLGKEGHKVMKVSRRDLPFVIAQGIHGATTVASTMIIAEMAGLLFLPPAGSAVCTVVRNTPLISQRIYRNWRKPMWRLSVRVPNLSWIWG